MRVVRLVVSYALLVVMLATAGCVDLTAPWAGLVMGPDAGFGKDSTGLQPDVAGKDAGTVSADAAPSAADATSAPDDLSSPDLPPAKDTAPIADLPEPDTNTLQTGLVAYYRCDERSGSTLSDSSGNGRDATLSSSGTFVSGKVGGAVSLSGTYATMPTNILAGFREVTVATWILLNSSFPNARIFEFRGDSTHRMWLTSNNSSVSMTGPLAFSMSAGAVSFNVVGPTVSTGSWIHVAIVLSGDSALLYVNGQLSTQASASVSLQDLGKTSSNLIGSSTSYDSAFFDGDIDEFRIYSRALGAAELKTLAGK